MNMPLKITILALALPIGSAAMADPAYTSASIITSLAAREYGVEVYLPNANNPMGCSSVGWFRVVTSAQNYQAISSTLLSAQAQQKTITVYANSCDTDGASLIVAVKVG
jgi:hypothetical protein